MTEEVKKEMDTPTPQDDAQKEQPTKKSLDIKKSLVQIDQERNEKDEQQRFGYFSVPYPSTIGDQAYSQKQEYHHKVIDRKVITENRGIYASGPKSGKNPDAYFPPPEIPENWIERNEKDKKIREEKEKKRLEKEKEEKKKLKEKYPFPYKPSGPQIAFSFYKKLDDARPIPEPDGPLTKEVDKKKYKIDHFKVKTSERNIQAAPTRSGNHPNDYFDFYRADDDLQKKLEEMNKKDLEDKIEKVKQNKKATPKIVFKPASLKLCEPFANDKSTFELHNDQEMGELLQKYKEDKSKGNPRYQAPKNPVHHDKPFSPASMVFGGRSGLFMYKSEEFYMNNDQRYTKEFQREEKERKEKEKETRLPIRKIREMESQKLKEKFPKAFTYNRLMKSSTFAPPISSYMVNIKRDFPTIKFH